ncbi:MAG: hypothetical protein ABH834_07910, partial [Candidatus Altiarchaeota archaeon]
MLCMVTQRVKRRAVEDEELSRVRDWLRGSFYRTESRSVPLCEIVGVSAELSGTHNKLLDYARESGFSAALKVCKPGEAWISRGVERGGISGRIVEYTRDVGGYWTAAAMQLQRQERSPKIVLSRMAGDAPVHCERKIKGGGVREHVSHRLPFGSSRQFIFSGEGVIQPFAVNGRLMSRVDEDWMMALSPYTSRSLWGAGTRGEADTEFATMLSVHKLLMAVDEGRPAGVHVPVSVEEITHVPVVVDGAEKVLEVVDYLTNPDVHCIKDLMLLAYWARNTADREGFPATEQEAVARYVKALESNDSFFGRRREFHSTRYLSVLSEDEVAGMEGSRMLEPGAREKLAQARKAAGPVLAKVFRLAQLHTVGRDDVRIQEIIDHVVYDSASKEDVDSALRVIYTNYGETLNAPSEGPALSAISKNMPTGIAEKEETVKGYLERVYELNREAADRILEKFTRNFFRDIGTLHGAGGYFGGYQPAMSSYSPMEEYGAPYGGSTESRNTDIMGVKHDLADDVYVPHAGLRDKTPDEQALGEMQAKDLYMAEVTLGRFKTLLTGRAEDAMDYSLADNRSVTYTRLDVRGSSDRNERAHVLLTHLREGSGLYPRDYSGEWKRLQGIRDEVYWSFHE